MSRTVCGARLVAFVAAILAAFLLAGNAGAQVVETRQGDANPMVSVFKSTIYGGLAGLIVGLAIEVAEDDDDSDAIRWGFVGGTFVGLGYGIYHVSSRPEPGRALLERGDDGWEWGLPEPELALVRPSPPALALVADRARRPEASARLHAPLVGWTF
jgi:hypothetical protein